MRLLQIVTVLSIALNAAAAQAQSVASCDLPHASGVSTEQLTSGQRPRSYRLFVPPGYDGRQRLPLVLDLHGSGGNAAGQARNSGLETLSATERFLVATLEAEGGRHLLNRASKGHVVGDQQERAASLDPIDALRAE